MNHVQGAGGGTWEKLGWLWLPLACAARTPAGTCVGGVRSPPPDAETAQGRLRTLRDSNRAKPFLVSKAVVQPKWYTQIGSGVFEEPGVRSAKAVDPKRKR